MPRYWVIAPVESNPHELFDKVWQFDLENNFISIGWNELGDVSRINREELSERIASTYPDKPLSARSLIANMIWAFYHEISPGDFIIARRGRKTLAAVGKVARSAFYDAGRNPHIDYWNFLEVVWQDQPRDKKFQSIAFPMHTVAEFSEEQFHKVLEGFIIDIDPPDISEDQYTFVLEKYLEDFIVSNFKAIFNEEIKIFVDANGNEGQQYTTDIGSIDILAVEPRTNTFVVIELKKGRPSDQVIGQVLRYMGWVKKNLCMGGQTVKGLIICRDLDEKLNYALEMTTSINVRYYSVSFKLAETPVATNNSP